MIDGGTSPDKKFSIVTGENEAGKLGVYLREAQTKKLIGQLEEVATDLDSAPDAYHAPWAPDSKHVGITSRADRHWADNAIYRIENRRAYPVETSALLCHAVPEFCQLTKQLGGALIEDQIYAEDTEGKPWKVRQNSSYSEAEKLEDESDESAALYHVGFDAEGECELLPDDKTRVLSTQPVKQQKAKE